MAIYLKCKKCDKLHSNDFRLKNCLKCGRSLTADPRYKVQVKTGTGINRVKTVKTLKEAKRVESLFFMEKDDPEFVQECLNKYTTIPHQSSPSDIEDIEGKDDTEYTFAKIFSLYLESAKPKKKTWKSDLDRYQKWIGPSIGRMRMDEIKTFNLQRIVDRMRQEGLSRSHTLQVFSLTNRVFNWANKMDLYTGNNPCKKVEIQKPDNYVNRFLSQEEIRRLVKTCRSWPNQRAALMFLFILNSGTRIQEATNLTWGNVDLERNLITITNDKNVNKQERYLHISEDAKQILQEVKQYKNSEYVFPTWKGTKLKHPSKIWHRIKEAADLPNYRVHDLRHTFASYLACQGISLYKIQQLLGHTTPVMTQRYAHLNDQAIKNVIQNFSYGESNAQ